MTSKEKSNFSSAADMLLAYPDYASFCGEHLEEVLFNLKWKHEELVTLYGSLLKDQEKANLAAFLSAQLSCVTQFISTTKEGNEVIANGLLNQVNHSAFQNFLAAVPSSELTELGSLIRSRRFYLGIPAEYISLADNDNMPPTDNVLVNAN